MPGKIVKKSKRRQRGGAFWDDAWSWLKKAHGWVKDNRIVSTLGRPLAAAFAPQAMPLVEVAAQTGYGRRKSCASCKLVRRRSRRQTKNII